MNSSQGHNHTEITPELTFISRFKSQLPHFQLPDFKHLKSTLHVQLHSPFFLSTDTFCLSFEHTAEGNQHAEEYVFIHIPEHISGHPGIPTAVLGALPISKTVVKAELRGTSISDSSALLVCLSLMSVFTPRISSVNLLWVPVEITPPESTGIHIHTSDTPTSC